MLYIVYRQPQNNFSGIILVFWKFSLAKRHLLSQTTLFFSKTLSIKVLLRYFKVGVKRLKNSQVG